MDGISAAASIIAIAEIGAQVALKIYKVADSYRSAAKEIRSISKNTALFASVLKDLGRVLERGEKVGTYRSDAYDNGRELVRECEAVFDDIIKGLGVEGKAGKVDRGTKALWLFNKPKVELWQGKLESLKATVSVQLAVLNYGETIEGPGKGGATSSMEMEALKAIILADRTARQEYDTLLALFNKQKADESGKHRSEPNAHDQDQGSGDISFNALNIDGNHSTEIDHSGSKGMDTLETEPPPKYSHSNEQGTPSVLEDIWFPCDRLERAIREFGLAQFEAECLEANLADPYLKDIKWNASMTKPLIARLKGRLASFGTIDMKRQDEIVKGLLKGLPTIDELTERTFTVGVVPAGTDLKIRIEARLPPDQPANAVPPLLQQPVGMSLEDEWEVPVKKSKKDKKKKRSKSKPFAATETTETSTLGTVEDSTEPKAPTEVTDYALIEPIEREVLPDNREENFDSMGNKIHDSKKKAKLTSLELRKKKKDRMKRRQQGEEVFSDESSPESPRSQGTDKISVGAYIPVDSFAEVADDSFASEHPWASRVGMGAALPQQAFEREHGQEDMDGEMGEVDWAESRAEELLRKYTFAGIKTGGLE